MPDKSKNTKIDGLNSFFEIKEVIIPNSNIKKYDVIFDSTHLQELFDDDVLTLVDIKNEVKELQSIVKSEIDLFLNSLTDDLKKIEVPVNKKCFKCEFSLNR